MKANLRYKNHIESVYGYIGHLNYGNGTDKIDRRKINTSLELISQLEKKISENDNGNESHEKSIERNNKYCKLNIDEYNKALAGMINNSVRLTEKLKKIGTPEKVDEEVISMLDEGIEYLDDIKSYYQTVCYTKKKLVEQKQSMLDYNSAVELLEAELREITNHLGLDADVIGIINENGINHRLIPKIKKTAKYVLKNFL